MHTVPDCTVKSFEDAEIGELVRLPDGTTGIVGFVGTGVQNREKAIACFPSAELTSDVPWLLTPTNDNPTLLSFGTDLAIWFDPLGTAIQYVGLMISKPPGALIVGKGALAIALTHPGRRSPIGYFEVVIREPTADQGGAGTRNERFAVLEWDIRLPAPYSGLPPLFTFKAG